MARAETQEEGAAESVEMPVAQVVCVVTFRQSEVKRFNSVLQIADPWRRKCCSPTTRCRLNQHFMGTDFPKRNVRWIEELDSTTAEIHRGDGRVFTFGNKDGNGDYTPPPAK